MNGLWISFMKNAILQPILNFKVINRISINCWFFLKK